MRHDCDHEFILIHFFCVYDNIPCYSVLSLFFLSNIKSPLKFMFPFGLDCFILCICAYKMIMGLDYNISLIQNIFLYKFSLIKQVVYEYILIVKFNKQMKHKFSLITTNSISLSTCIGFCITSPKHSSIK